MLEVIQHDTVCELRFSRAPVNALDPALVARLRDEVAAAPQRGARAIVLSGSPGIFSAGLDLPALLPLARAELGRFWNDFFGLCATLARSPIPTAAAITGHSPAGGAVLAIMCDYRVMARGAFRIGLNEVQVGLSVPDCLQAALRRLLGPYRAERLLVSGAMLEAEQAHAIGLVDELVEADLVVPRALLWIEELLKLPGQAMLATRRMARADLAEVFAEPERLPVEEFLDGWFAAEAQAVLQALVRKLKSKS